LKLALCTLDKKQYDASDFSENDQEWIARHRLELSCIACDGPAFFRKASSSGQAACFGARPHAKGCQLATLPTEQAAHVEAVEKDVRTNPGRLFDLKLSGPKKVNREATGTHPVLKAHDVMSAAYKKIGRKYETKSTIDAKECLINLVLSEQYRESVQLIRAPYGRSMAIRHFFTKFEDATEAVESVRGYWGTFFEPGSTMGARWLNTGRSRQHMSVCLEPNTEAELLANYGLESVEQMTGSWALIVGELKLSKTGKLYVTPKNAKHVVLYIPEDSDD
jgi:hypothetical protein